MKTNRTRLAAAATFVALAAPALAQSAGFTQQPRPHHANYAADAQYPRRAQSEVAPADRSLEPYHRPHHAE